MIEAKVTHTIKLKNGTIEVEPDELFELAEALVSLFNELNCLPGAFDYSWRVQRVNR